MRSVFVVLPLVSVGCGGEEPTGPGSGGDDDGLVSKAAWSVSFLSEGPECGLMSHNATMGTVTSTTKTALLSDGQAGVGVSCGVSGLDTFGISATARQDASELTLSVSGLTGGETAASPGGGYVSYSFASAGAVKSFASPANACRFWFTPPSQGIAAGRVWLTFACDAILDAGHTCALSESYAIFENCGD